jgi:hypothetical protein
MAAVPAAAVEAVAKISKAIVNAAVKPDLGAPIALMEEETSALPSPPSGCPEVSGFGCFDPGPWNPVIAIVGIVGPVARGP